MRMKRRNVFATLMLGFFALSLTVTAGEKTSAYQPGKLPAEVNEIIQQKCFGCHNTDSRNDKAKEKLDFKTLDDLTAIKKVSAYNKITEELEKKEMPPEKFLEHFPDKNITEDERTALMDWAKKEAEALVKGM